MFYGYFLVLPTFLPTFSRELVTDCLAPNKYPPTPFKNLPNRDPTGVAPPYSELWDPQFLLTYYSTRPVSCVSFTAF